MSATQLSDAQGEAIRPHLPARPRMGRPRATIAPSWASRRPSHAILFVMRAGCRWGDLPATYGVAGTTA